MPLFEGHKDKGIDRLFIDLPDDKKSSVIWKYPDSQIIQHSIVNVDIDYVAVFTNLGKVIGTLPPGRHELDEGASLAFGWLVDRLTGNSYYDAELYYVTTRDIPDINFGGPVDNISDSVTGLIVAVRAFGNLAFKVSDPIKLISKLVGTSGVTDHENQIVTWVQDQVLSGIRVELPSLIKDHGVLFLGEIQQSLMENSLKKANDNLEPYGVCLSAFAQLNVNVPEEDLNRLRTLSEAKAYTQVAGSFGEYAKGEAMLDIARGIEDGKATTQSGMMGFMMNNSTMGQTSSAPVQNPAPAVQGPVASPVAGGVAKFCSNCGTALVPGAKFCSGCGNAVPSVPSATEPN
jgi:membrane protease subunit (stomatin/prohibitin family)